MSTSLARRGRVEIEDVLSGPGIVNLFRFTHAGVPPAACPVLAKDTDETQIAAETTATALARECPHCIEALHIFVDAYGAESGNLALRSMALACFAALGVLSLRSAAHRSAS